MTLMTIGEFAERSRLSPKALRLYDRLGLVVPARVDASSAYRLYSEDQVEAARLVGLLRRLDVPLAVIASVLEMDAARAATAIAEYWSQVEAVTADRRALVRYLQELPTGERTTMYAARAGRRAPPGSHRRPADRRARHPGLRPHPSAPLTPGAPGPARGRRRVAARAARARAATRNTARAGGQ